jgi:hypothetical protein
VKRWKRILAGWLGVNLIYLLTLLIMPHRPIELASFASYSLQTLLFIISIYIFRLEPTRKNRYIFLNFAILFSLSIIAHFYSFIGPDTLFFSTDKWARFFVDQYVFRFAYFALLSLSVVYIAIDLLLRDFNTLTKYVVAFVIVGSFAAYYYGPIIQDPLYLHRTQDVLDWKQIADTEDAFKKTNGWSPSLEELTGQIPEMYTYNGGKRIGTIYPEEKILRIKQLYPYLYGRNWMILVYKPLYQNAIYMSVICLGFILLFFGYQYMKDPPQGAYIEKIMFFLLLFCTLEILHAYSSIQILEWDGYLAMTIVGQYVSTAVLFLLTIFFGLRLRFITSANGEFYEQEVLASPRSITRWRDIVDEIVLEKFFNRKLVLGRLMVDPGAKRTNK